MLLLREHDQAFALPQPNLEAQIPHNLLNYALAGRSPARIFFCTYCTSSGKNEGGKKWKSDFDPI